MLGVFRRFVGILLVVVLTAPAALAACTLGGDCAPDEGSDHSCCTTPVLSNCACADAAAMAHNDAEPARRDGADPVRHAFLSAPAVILVPARTTTSVPADHTPPRDTGGRLSLLSILIV